MDTIRVEDAKLNELTKELEDAASDFNKNFNELESTILGLKNGSFKGDASESLVNTFETKVKPKLDEMKKTTDKATNYVDNQTNEFHQVMGNVIDTMNSTRV